MDIQQLAVKVESIEERQDRMDERQGTLEKAHQAHREEFAETRVYVKETYKQLSEINASLRCIEKTTSERIDQQARFYREEQKVMEKEIQALQQKPQSQPIPEAPAPKKDANQQILDFSWKVVAGVFMLATAVLGILQATGGKLPIK